MKRMAGLFGILCLLTGCFGGDRYLDRAMSIRQSLLGAAGASFEADITADYGDKLYSFSMSCEVDAQGELQFTVTAPETIAGITGTVSESGGKLTFDDTALQFDLLADDQFSPVSAPWVLMKTLRGGYLTSAGMEEELLRLTIDDSYQEDALQLDIWLNGEDQVTRGEILHNGRRILTMEVSNYRLL